MKNIFSILIFITFSFLSEINAQQASVAICGWDGDDGDEITFVALRDFSAGEIIYFTEDEYSIATGSFNTGEGHFAYTVGAGGLSEDEVVGITESSANAYTIFCDGGGSATHVSGTGNWSFSDTDELYAYSASNPASPWNSITEIHCFVYAAVIVPPADQVPSSDYPNVIEIMINIGGSGGMNAYLNDAARLNTTIPQLQNSANWVKSTGGLNLSCTDFVNNLLPIELMSFDATTRGDIVELAWTTATEINNEFFEIEHSKDGQIFTKIGAINGSGTTYRSVDYTLMHEDPIAGINYYRLKQIDFDGAYSYSDIKYAEYEVRERIGSIYPNPFGEQITINFSDYEINYPSDKLNQIEIFDSFGKLVFSIESHVGQKDINLNLTELDGGVYFIRCHEANKTTSEIHRIIKL